MSRKIFKQNNARDETEKNESRHKTKGMGIELVTTRYIVMIIYYTNQLYNRQQSPQQLILHVLHYFSTLHHFMKSIHV